LHPKEEAMKQPPPNHDSAFRRQVYLLTCWREFDKMTQTETWRFKLETPGAGQRRLFRSLEEIMAVIETELQRGDPEA
jgi:hypothetical protein